MTMLVAALLAAAAVGTPNTTAPDSTPKQRFEAIPWQQGGTGALGTVAQVKVPDACSFTGREGTKTFMELTQNPSGDGELGTIVCHDSTVAGNGMWFVVFTYDAMGYVKDDERDKLDADAMLKSLKEGTEAGNKYRKERGWEAISITGWDHVPFYDTRTNNLTWATILRGEEGGENINHSIRLLGRGGVMDVDLVVTEAEKAGAMPVLDEIVAGFQYRQGQRYAEWRTGDKVAAVGLTGLVVGGAGAVAAKTGLLAKLGKLLVAAGKAVIVGVVALFAWLKRLVTGKKDDKDASA